VKTREVLKETKREQRERARVKEREQGKKCCVCHDVMVGGRSFVVTPHQKVCLCLTFLSLCTVRVVLSISIKFGAKTVKFIRSFTMGP
jgi:hypothetical protein